MFALVRTIIKKLMRDPTTRLMRNLTVAGLQFMSSANTL
jgi:hypothetical protein